MQPQISQNKLACTALTPALGHLGCIGVLRQTIAGMEWEMVPEFLPYVSSLMMDNGEVVKQTPAKLVTRHLIPSGPVYVKRYRNQDLGWRALKFLVKESHAHREWRLAHAIESRGIPVVRHLAYGERRSRFGVQESVLITESFSGVPLCEYRGRGRPEVQQALGRFMRLMHERGILQFDLFGNILVRETPLELRRVDVHHAELLSNLTQQQRIDNIAFLNSEVPLTDDFFATYGWTDSQALVTRQRSMEMRKEFYAHRARRCFRHNADFMPLRCGDLRCWVRRASYDEPMRSLLADPDGFLASAKALKRGRSATVGSAGGRVIKRFNLRRASNLVKNCFRASRAKLAFRRAYHLELVGIPTARALAAAERRLGPILLRSYFVMEEIPGATDLSQYLGDPMEAAEKVARLLAKLHNEGFSNRDLKETNILFGCDGRAYLIDLEGLRFHGKVPRSRALADLARLERGVRKLPHCSARHRWRFLRIYFRERCLRPSQIRAR